ncbi:ATP phosphoribosyltransferase regulatory subunit [Sellimonas intestinalis]|uniref:ATP phosphoribosyltransferase regulatory subunit n=1 Tax=Sellimonas intestinalis TaxID=1653434 RepID=UPI00399A323B
MDRKSLRKRWKLRQTSFPKRTIKRLRDTYEILKAYTVQKYITFDLSMSGTYGYYTGVIFRAYTFGTGDAIVKGGRYNHLMEKFGKRAPSIGFAVIIDELMNSLARQHVQISYEENNVIIVYADSQRRQAVSLAKEFRARKNSTELFCKKSKGNTG